MSTRNDHPGQLLTAPGTFKGLEEHYTMTFGADARPPVDRSRGGFWSLTMYNLVFGGGLF